MGGQVSAASIWRFGAFEMNGRTAELRRNGITVKLQEQPAQLLLLLLEHAGEIVTREDLRRNLWAADTFVDFDHSVNTAIMKLREALGDSRERPLYIQTLPRKGYRFVAPVARLPSTEVHPAESTVDSKLVTLQAARTGGRPAEPISGLDTIAEPLPLTMPEPDRTNPRSALGASIPTGGRSRMWRLGVTCAALLLLVAAGALVYRMAVHPAAPERALTRLTFDEGLQSHPTWSPDGRYLAYSSDKGGATNIWVQQIGGGDPVQITRGPGPNWHPDWSPDGRFIAYRSEAGRPGIYIVPALGGAGQERMIAPFGDQPKWSPDSTHVLFQSGPRIWKGVGSLALADLEADAPRPVLGEFFNFHKKVGEVSAAWHPDGKRVTLWTVDPTRPGPSPSFWTMSLDGGDAVQTFIPPEIENRFAELAPKSGNEWTLDSQFSWAPAGDALYFEQTLRGARSIWRLAVDPKSLKATGLERLTTGGTRDTAPAISPDGKKLAFTAGSGQISAWMYPLDANRGKIVGSGRPVTSPGIDAWLTITTRDGSKLAFSGIRAGEGRLWVKTLPDGVETPLFVDSFRNIPQWSPDGRRLAYRRTQHASDMNQIVIWSEDTRREEPVTSLRPLSQTGGVMVYDWSPDGKTLLISRVKPNEQKRGASEGPDANTARVTSWALPLAAAPHAELQERMIISDPQYSIYQEHFSPDGRWIVFEAITSSNVAAAAQRSTLYVMRATGGPWIAVTPNDTWADKPRWSPNGRLIYFLSGRDNFLNVWAVRFDPERAQPEGEAFRVTALDSPSLAIPGHMGTVEISISDEALVLTLERVTGGIWMLDNVAP